MRIVPSPYGEDPWRIDYFESDAGAIPVLEWLLDMSPRERALALRHIGRLALLGVEAQRPLVAPLGDKLYELRWKADGKQYRIAYCAVRGRTFLLLHGIVKKRRAWSNRDLQLARTRLDEYERRRRNEP